ncbi:hypothetical protein HUB98_03495 [Paenibacillus barcinonensis]|uniref:Uncharacterized protein n=1 Tax=Paenibacillus barcinonensis TaxID=198119 RepID=A0A2V4VRY8_PAEBA|nr:hypothetical protein [Paenibacillus barcinonensis]PYE49239.1 hypothetical protein DFQ00_106222 [Paenibacillus barcinonensis]QKS55470.1 hypothetical protein HUB98_03495 [Paenibacillus barcinonensis]
MSRNTQHLMLFCTAVVLFVAACLYGQRNVLILTSALNERTASVTAMEGRIHMTLHSSQPNRYTGAEVLHTVRQMTGTGIQVEVDGLEYIIDPFANPSATIPVELEGNYLPTYNRGAAGELLKLSFRKEVKGND